MNSLTFNDISFNPINRQDKQIWLTSAQLAEALEYSDVRSVTNIYNRKKDEFTSGMTTVIKLITNGINGSERELETRIFSLRGCHLIAMFARTAVAKQFRQWVLDILDKEVGQPTIQKTTTEDRTPLRQAVSLLVGKKGIAYDEAYNLVHQYMGVSSIDQIPLNDLPKAVAYIHSLIFHNHNTIMYNLHNLVWSTMHIYNWYKNMENAFYALSPHITSPVHDHINDAKANANRLHQLMGFEFDINCPKRLTQY